MIAQTELKRLFEYCPGTGEFYRKVSTSQKTRVGDIAGSIKKSDGYKRIKIAGKSYLSHRLAFLFMTGDWPKDQVDHIDHIRHNNRWDNIRPATRDENAMNQKLHSSNTSGVSGVSFDSIRLKWRARINKNGKRISLGYFKSKSDAVIARLKASDEIGYHKNHGILTPLKSNEYEF